MNAQLQPVPSKSFLPKHTIRLQRKRAYGRTFGSIGECEACLQKKQPVRERGPSEPSSTSPRASDVSEAPPIVHEVLRSTGERLNRQTRSFMEPRFGHSFGDVRVHMNSLAARSAEQTNALAYTVGRDIVFAAGQYAPDTNDGRRLLAHELAHVVQQNAMSDAGGKTITMESPGAETERQAQEASEHATRDARGPVLATAIAPRCLQRQRANPGLPIMDRAVVETALQNCPNLQNLLGDWYTAFYVARVRSQYRSPITDRLPSFGALRLWKSLSGDGELDMDINFIRPGRTDQQHVKLLVRLERSEGPIVARARLYDWFGTERVLIGSADVRIIGTGQRCRLEEIPAAPVRRIPSRPIFHDDEDVPV